MNKKVLIGTALAVVVAATAAGAWWWKKPRGTQAPAGDALVADPNAPFEFKACQARLHEDRPALAVTFSAPIGPGQALDQLIEVKDFGDATSTASGAAGRGETGTVVKGSWVVADNPRVLVFPFVKAGHRYDIKLAAGIAGENGRKLAGSQTCEVTSDQMAPSFFFASKGTVLPAELNGGLPVVSVNVPEVDVEFLRVESGKLAKFMDLVAGRRSERSEDEGEEYCCDYYYNRNAFKGQTSGWQLNALRGIAESVYSNRFLVNDAKNARKTSFLPIEKVAELKEPGVYVAVMRRPGNFDNDYQVTYFYVTDIGLHVRRHANATDVFTTSLKSGKGLGGIDIEVLGEGGKVLLKGRTDGDGHGVLAGLPDKAQVLLARRDKEMSMISLREPGLDLSEFDIGGHLPRDAKLFAYSGRDLYRPGEQFTVSLLARNAGGAALPPAPIKVELKKPGGDVASTVIWQPNPKTPGYLQQRVDLPADAATGKWTLEFRADPAAKRPDTVYAFQVEEFLPERMKLTLGSDNAALRPGTDSFGVAVQGDYLYGAPAAGNRLLGSVAQERARNPLPKEWPGFIFGDFADDANKQRTELPETELDDSGKAQVDVPVKEGMQSPSRVRASFSLLESGGRPVVRSVERMWWPADAMIALRPAFEGDVAHEGGMAEFELIRVDSAGKFAPLKEAKFRLVREDRQYYWRFDADRGWHSGYTEAEEVQQDGAVALKARAKLTLPVQWGTYRLEVADPSTSLVARYRFYAGWGAQDAESVGNRPDRVRLQLDGVPAKPGSDVRVKILPPHDGEALVMVEADKVLWSTRVSVNTGGTTVTVPVEKGWNRADMYISTIVYRPGSQGDRVTPARAVGMSWLPLAREGRKLKVALTAPEQVVPDKRMVAKVKVDGAAGKAAMVTVSAVDAGILSITSFKSPDPFDFFFGKHRFGPELNDIYGKMIERMDGTVGKIKWGGDAGKRDTKSMPKKVKLVDIFSGVVQLNAKGEADVPLDIPDFNGTLRLMAVASTADAYGSADREVVVSAPIVAELSMPRFVGPGDKSTLALDVTNMMGGEQDIDIRLGADRLLRVAEGERKLKLANRQRKILRFAIEPTEPYGLSRITLDVKTGGAKPVAIHREFALQIQPPVAREVDARRIRIAPGTTEKLDPTLAERFFRGSGTLNVAMSNKPPLNVRSIVKGLLDYPYGCLEQTTSAAYPHVFIDEEGAKAVGLEPRSREQRTRFIEGAIGRIGGMQGAEGGFRLWGGEGPYESWLTPYVTSFLMDARDAGFSVPEDMVKKSQRWMTERLNGASSQLVAIPAGIKPDARGQYAQRDYELLRNAHQRFAELAHIGYMLARDQKASLASLRLLHDQHRQVARSPLPLIHLGIALQLMGDAKRAETAINDAMGRPYGIRSDWEWDWLGDYGSALRDQGLAYALMVRHKVEHPQRENLLPAVAERMNRRYYSTQERIALFLASRAAGGASSEPWQAEIRTADGASALTSRSTELRSLDPALAAKGISIENQGSSPLWVEVEAGGFPLKTPAPSSDKMTIERKWFRPDGKPWNGGTLKVGDMLLVRLKASAPQHIEDAMIVDHIPAGLEVENLNLSQGPQAGEFTVEGVNLAAAMANERIKHREFRDDRFVAAVRLDGQPLHLFYMLRVVTPGRFAVPGTFGEDMYRPAIRAHGPAGEAVTVVDR